ncbi:MAG: alpha-hydroxy-acid oxidizing protein [Rhodocyclaceae bacterium]|jgi:isopentenyl diphosphate isomerase/L-lactate dehydrogenase-like FMN-dependent dehydrogenase|nr:alpha-hydroxy-acid oxidizing protein [Rhodocyclaceae bacterium]MCA3144016.1 alpha-hydroxy-acid oxidizing protein [Rhodocyclaceae bacterium]
MNGALNIADLRAAARRRLPRAMFEFVDGGAYDEVTLRANREDFDHWRFLPRVLTDVSVCDLSTTVLGGTLQAPLILAPTGLAGLLHRRGELSAARAAQGHGVPYCLSTMATCSIEQIAAASSVQRWFQLYVLRDRGLTRAFIERARAAGCHALVLTVDTKVQGPRERDLRNGFTVPPRFGPGTLVDFLRHWRWLMDVGLGPKVSFRNFEGTAVDNRSAVSIGQFIAGQYDLAVSWRDVAWFKSLWGGPLALKGVLSPEDARMALDHGVDALIVSNHGGRQLDGAVSALQALPAVVEAVQGRAEVILDGGVRRGSDVVKALCLGARACMVGRAWLYGLAAAGEAGVDRALQILVAEMAVTLRLLGRTRLDELGRHCLVEAPGRRPG